MNCKEKVVNFLRHFFFYPSSSDFSSKEGSHFFVCLIFRKKFLSPLILSLFFCVAANAQNLLDQKITINFEDQNVEDALSDIADAGGFNFSYNSDLIAADRRVAVNSSNQSVKEVLDDVLGKKMNYKVRGSYVIIQPPKQKKPKQTFQISGEIKDASTGKKIEDVTIYEVNKLKSTLSGSDGKYDMTVSRKAEFVNVAISKKNYRDTVIRISKLEPLPTTITLTPLKNERSIAQSAIDSAELVKFFVSSKIAKNMENVEMEERRRLQISFLPFAGTNRLMSGKITNELSFNILAGYSKSVEGAEVGGIANIVRKNMTGIQVGGIANYVGKETKGIQIGGLLNVNGGKVTGMQAAGWANLAVDTISGWQVAGLFNLAQMTDFVQVAGLTNISWQKAKNFQISGIGNYTKDLEGMQVASMTNVASGKMQGAQIGLLNFAGNVKGFQLGIVNVADTVSSGINIGLISYVRKGLHKWQYARNDAIHHNLSFKTGTYKFYNILTGGYRQQNEGDLWSVGYGFGSQYNFKKKATINLELTANAIQKGADNFADLNALGKLNLNLGYRFAKYFSISAGPILYTYVSETLNPDTGDFGYGIATKPFRNETFSPQGINLKMWVGWQAAVMF